MTDSVPPAARSMIEQKMQHFFLSYLASPSERARGAHAPRVFLFPFPHGLLQLLQRALFDAGDIARELL